MYIYVYIYYLLDMMDRYWTCEEDNPLYVPYLIDEIFYFNSFVEPHVFNGN